jgi:predicted small lipoprotein YifL
MTRSRLKNLILTLLVVLMTISVLSACGKKSRPQPPQGKETGFPHQYPSY